MKDSTQVSSVLWDTSNKSSLINIASFFFYYYYLDQKYCDLIVRNPKIIIHASPPPSDEWLVPSIVMEPGML